MINKIKNIYLCIDKGQPIAHAVETIEGVVIGTKLDVSHKGMHQVAKDIQETFNITPIQHLMLMKEAVIMDRNNYQSLLDGCEQISFEEAKGII